MPIMRPISTPSWAQPFERRVAPEFGEGEFTKLLPHHSAIMLIVQTAVQTYVDDFAVTTDSGSDDFPIADRLSGDYYIACESYWVQDEPWFPRVGRERTYCFSVMARCLEHPQAPHQTDLDYLGLEVHFLWNVASSEFMFTGDVDSSSI